jgi:hypothetical protein
MKQFILNNIDKICISLGGIFLFEILMKYNNLKYHNEYSNKYSNIKIKNEKLYQIEMYKKTNINKINKFNKFNKYFRGLKDNRFQHSISIIFKNDDEYKIYDDAKFINPQNYLFYDNN